MIKVNLFDQEFIHTEKLLGYITSSDTRKPLDIEWVNGLMNFDGITVFTDRYISSDIVNLVNSKLKVAWLLESKAINPIMYETIKSYEERFDYILTHDEILLARSNKYVKSLVGSSRVNNEDFGIHQKSKLVSMIASNKRNTIGHNLRHQIASHYGSKFNIDLWGSGYKHFTNKTEPLKDYMFSISVMNIQNDNFFTEVLIDNFMLGTVPIYWGNKNIGDYFDIEGMIIFNNLNELDNIFYNLSLDDYNNRIEHIKNNLEIAKKYISTDDIIANILKKIIDESISFRL